MPNRDPSDWNLSPVTGQAIGVQPLVQILTSTANLAVGAALNLDLSIDTTPILDLYIYADQVLTVSVNVRSSATGTYRQVGNNYLSVASALIHILQGYRCPGSDVRVTITNNTAPPSGGATTSVEIDLHARSL